MRNFLRDLVALVKPYKKAIWSGVIAAAFAAWPLLSDGHLSYADAGQIVAAFAAGAGIVYKVANAPMVSGTRKAS